MEYLTARELAAPAKVNASEQRPNCPECGSPMQGHGTAFSGRHRVRRWQCPQCGRCLNVGIVTGPPSGGRKGATK